MIRTVCVRFGRKLAECNKVAARVQFATGSCQKLGTCFDGDHNDATHLIRENTQSWLRNSFISLTIRKSV